MKKLLPCFLFLTLIYSITLKAQVAPDIEWQKCLGGTNNEAAFSVRETADKGFIVGGYSDSNNGDVTGNHGADDFWVVKLHADASIDWQTSLGGNSLEEANSIQQTFDGGYIVAGYTYSTNGDVSGNHGPDDFWVVRLDAAGGIDWQKCLGGSGDDAAWSIQQTKDKGFIVAGHSSSTDGDVTGNHGAWDFWVVKLDSSGTMEWEKSYGGSSNDVAYAIQQTEDGGYIVGGYSESSDNDVSGNNGLRDYWIVKTEEDGTLTWETHLGSSGYDEVHALQQTGDGGYIVAGFAGTNDGDVSGNNGGYDYWLVKLDGGGSAEWKYCYGGSSTDQPFGVDQTIDHGFIVSGQSLSTNGNVTGNHGGYDFWVMKTDAAGIIEWQKSLGGTADEYGPYSVQQTSDQGFIMSGSTLSDNGDVSGYHGGSFYGDMWVVKLKGAGPTGINTSSASVFSFSPNPVQSQLTINFAAAENDVIIMVYDQQGRMMALPIHIENSQAQVNTLGLAGGFYTLQVIDSKTGKREVGRFVKSSQ